MPFPYMGSKFRLSKQLPEPLPDVPIFEPFAGGAGYSVRYGAYRDVRLSDTNPAVVKAWEFVINASPANVLHLPDRLVEGTHVDDLDMDENAQAFLTWHASPASSGGGASGKVTSRGDCRTALRFDRKIGAWDAARRQHLAETISRFATWSICDQHFLNAPDEHGTWFIDPPYGGLKRYGRFSSVDERCISDFARSRTGLVIVTVGEHDNWLPHGAEIVRPSNASGYPGNRYRERVAVFRTVYSDA